MRNLLCVRFSESLFLINAILFTLTFCSAEVNTSSLIYSKSLDNTLKINSSTSPMKQPSNSSHFFNKENKSGVNNLSGNKSSSSGISSNETISKVFSDEHDTSLQLQLELKNIISGMKLFNKSDFLKHVINNFNKNLNYGLNRKLDEKSSSTNTLSLQKNEYALNTNENLTYMMGLDQTKDGENKDWKGHENIPDIDRLNLLNEKLFASKRFIHDNIRNSLSVSKAKLEDILKNLSLTTNIADNTSQVSSSKSHKIKTFKTLNSSFADHVIQVIHKSNTSKSFSSELKVRSADKLHTDLVVNINNPLKRQLMMLSHLNPPSVNQNGLVLPSPCNCPIVVTCNCHTTDVQNTTYKDILKEWNWGHLFSGFVSDSVGKANIGFIVDGSIDGKLLSITQRFIYNIILLLKKRSYISVATAGKSMKLVFNFQSFDNMDKVKEMLLLLTKNNDRNIIGALEQFYLQFKSIHLNGNKNVLFLFLNEKLNESETKLIATQEKYAYLDINIFVVEFGFQSFATQINLLTDSSKIFHLNLSNAMIEENARNSLMKNEPIIAAAMKSIYQLLNVETEDVYLSSTQLDWWYKEWSWNKYLKNFMNEKIGPANLAFVIDGTNSHFIIFIQKLVYNYISLFQLRGTFVTIAVYGKSSYVIIKWQMFNSPLDIQKSCESIPLIQARFRESDNALENIYSMFSVQQKKNQNPCVLFLVLTGSSKNSQQLSFIGERIRKIGVKLYTIGIAGDKAMLFKELKGVAYSEKEQYIGSPSYLVNMLSAVSLSLVKFIGKSKIQDYEKLNVNEEYRRLQSFWDWRSSFNSLKYGYISRANVGILVDGTIDEEYFDAVRRLVYNIMRCYSLAGTHFNVVSYATSVYEISTFRQYRSGNDIRKFAKIIPKLLFGVRNTGGAMWTMLNAFSEAPPENPSIVYILTGGSSEDDIIAPSNMFRNFGIIAFACSLNGKTSTSELTLMSSTPSTVFFSSSFDDLINLVLSMQVAAAEMIGTVSKASGLSSHLINTPTDILRTWQWQNTGTFFSYSSVGRASVGFLIDGTSSIHFDFLQKFTYNIFKLFAENSSVAIMTYGGAVDKSLGIFRNYADNYALQAACSAIIYKGEAGRRIGGALLSFNKLFSNVTGNKVLFLITLGKSEDDVNKPAKLLSQLGVSIFTIGIGREVEKNELKTISRFYLATEWNSLIDVVASIQISLIKVIGKNPASKSRFSLLLNNNHYLGRTPLKKNPWGDVVFSNATDLKLKWNWNHLLPRIKYGVLDNADVVILVDVATSDDLDVIRRFLFNIIKLFRAGMSTFTVVGYGESPNLVFGTRKFTSDSQIRRSLEKLEPVKGNGCNIGQALAYFKETVYHKILLLTTMKRVLGILISRSPSSDDVVEYSDSIKGAGITMVAIGKFIKTYVENFLRFLCTCNAFYFNLVRYWPEI